MKELPLFRRGQIVAYALVDDADFEFLQHFTWHLDTDGYPVRGCNIRLHRELLRADEGFEVDHIDRNPLNATRMNLRVCDRAFQGLNSSPRGSIPHKGVRPISSGSFAAVIWLEGRDYFIGAFRTVEDAARAYDAYREHVFPGWCDRNIPDKPLLLFDAVELLRISSRKNHPLPLYVREAVLLEKVRQYALRRMKTFKEVEERGWYPLDKSREAA